MIKSAFWSTVAKGLYRGTKGAASIGRDLVREAGEFGLKHGPGSLRYVYKNSRPLARDAASAAVGGALSGAPFAVLEAFMGPKGPSSSRRKIYEKVMAKRRALRNSYGAGFKNRAF